MAWSIVYRDQQGQQSQQITGLDYNGNPSGRRGLKWLSPMSAYPATYLFRVYQRNQVTGVGDNNRYYTTFFHGNDGSFTWDGTHYPDSYYGAHPYPVTPPTGNGKWEIAASANDFVDRDDNSSPYVTNDQWYSQAFLCENSGGSNHWHKFYITLPSTSTANTITYTRGTAYYAPPTPSIMVGQASDPWGGNSRWEEQNAIIRGMQFYSSKLTEAQVIALSECETDAQVLAYCSAQNITSLWYLNMNPTTSDVTDKSGNGHHPSWSGAYRPADWSGSPPLPSWVPAAGEVVSYTGGGSVLSNNWRAIHDPNGVGYDAFHSRKVTNYSSRFLHPTWGAYGGLVIWGGGHSATNYNGVTMLTFSQGGMRFECVQSPYDWQQASLDTGSLSANSEFNTYGEAQSGGTPSNPLKILGPHSYAAGAVVNGKFVQIFSSAADYLMEFQDMVAHEIDLSNLATSYNSRAWVRRTNSKGAWEWDADPICGRYVPHQGGRIYVASRGPGGPYSPQWYDLTNNTWSTGSGTGFDFPAGVAETGGLIYAAARDLLICAYKSSGNLVLQYMDVSSGVSQPTLGGTASLSASLAIPDEWGAISWCSDSNRILVFGVTGNTNKVYEITIPATLSNTWTVDSYTLPNSATIVPAANSGVGAYGVSYDYNPLTKSIVFLQDGIVDTGNDTVRVYRPRNT